MIVIIWNVTAHLIHCVCVSAVVCMVTMDSQNVLDDDHHNNQIAFHQQTDDTVCMDSGTMRSRFI